MSGVQVTDADPGPGRAEVAIVARGIATAVAPEGGITDVQASILSALTEALTGIEVDYHDLEPLGPSELARVLVDRTSTYRQRIVHHMVLAEMVLRPIPVVVAHRVAGYAEALGVRDEFVRVARRYAQGAYGLAWLDLSRNGFVDHVVESQDDGASSDRAVPAPFRPAEVDPELAARWHAFEDLPRETLGRRVWEMYDGRGFVLPGEAGGAPRYLAQHDFVHVIADYGTNLKGEIEVFAFIGRADPDPKGFAWFATLAGLFETGYIRETGFFVRDVRERNIQAMGMHHRLADAIRRGRAVCDHYGTDLFDVDYGELAAASVEEVRAMLGVPAKAPAARSAGSPGVFDVAGMSEVQRAYVAQRGG